MKVKLTTHFKPQRSAVNNDSSTVVITLYNVYFISIISLQNKLCVVFRNLWTLDWSYVIVLSISQLTGAIVFVSVVTKTTCCAIHWFNKATAKSTVICIALIYYRINNINKY